MSYDWNELPTGDLVSRGPGGVWTLLKTAQGWSPVPPNGRGLPYALVATMVQAPCLPSMKHAAHDCHAFLTTAIGEEQIRKDGCARTPDHLEFQFIVTSCGITFSVQRGKTDTTWKAEWSAWDRFGTLESDDLNELVVSFREPILQDAGYTPPGFREALISEDQRIESRRWVLAEYSSAVASRLKTDDTSRDAVALGNRAVALGEMLERQAKDEALLMERRSGTDIYPGLI